MLLHTTATFPVTPFLSSLLGFQIIQYSSYSLHSAVSLTEYVGDPSKSDFGLIYSGQPPFHPPPPPLFPPFKIVLVFSANLKLN